MLKLEISDILKSYGTLIGVGVGLIVVGVPVGESVAVGVGVDVGGFPCSAIATPKIKIEVIITQANISFFISPPFGFWSLLSYEVLHFGQKRSLCAIVARFDCLNYMFDPFRYD